MILTKNSLQRNYKIAIIKKKRKKETVDIFFFIFCFWLMKFLSKLFLNYIVKREYTRKP